MRSRGAAAEEVKWYQYCTMFPGMLRLFCIAQLVASLLLSCLSVWPVLGHAIWSRLACSSATVQNPLSRNKAIFHHSGWVCVLHGNDFNSTRTKRWKNCHGIFRAVVFSVIYFNNFVEGGLHLLLLKICDRIILQNSWKKQSLHFVIQRIVLLNHFRFCIASNYGR